MHFAPLVPPWLIAFAALVFIGAAAFVYRRPLAPLSSVQRGLLIALRAAAFLVLLLFISRPVVMRPPATEGNAVVAILVDTSRSMGIKDGGNDTRLARAVAVITNDLLPRLPGDLTPEIFTVGDACRHASAANCGPYPVSILTIQGANGNHSDLGGALAYARDAYRSRRVAGIVLVSDGADTGHPGAAFPDFPMPVFTIGVGSIAGVPDREVTGLVAGDPRLDQASIDLHVSVVSRGFGRSPFDLRVSANGRMVETRRVTPLADGAPLEEVFTAAPDASAPTVYTAEIAPAPGEQVAENNTRSVLVSPRGRKRRVLVLEGAPGYEGSFFTRALAADPDSEIDSVVRKGKNDAGQDTFLVQASAGRAASLTSGFPARREDLFAYDAVVVANVSGDSLTRAQLLAMADFVSARGGGLLVLGGLSFEAQGLAGTPLEAVLPVELGDRRGGLMRLSFGAGLAGPLNSVVLTPEGERHPVMRIGTSVEDTREKWAALPSLAASAPLGGPRAGATILAVTSVPGGAIYPVVAVQSYGLGRSMVFGGEASWRWRMMQPLTDRSYEFFWRQAVRWLSAPAPDAVSVAVPDASQAGDTVAIDAAVRGPDFLSASDAAVSAKWTAPGGESAPLVFRHEAGPDGHFAATIRAEQKGVYQVHLEATRGGTRLGAADRWFYAGGADRELADPRLNEGALKRLARATGGRYVTAADAAQVAAALAAARPRAADLEPHDLWQEPWMLTLAVALLGAEWSLRRRWGLR